MSQSNLPYRVLYRKPEWGFWAIDQNHYSLNGAIKCARYYQRMHDCETKRLTDDEIEEQFPNQLHSLARQ